MVGDGKSKLVQEQGPTGLMGTESLRRALVFKILVVGPNHKRYFGAL